MGDAQLSLIDTCHRGGKADGDGDRVFRRNGLRGKVEGLAILGDGGGKALRSRQRAHLERCLTPVVDAVLAGEVGTVGAPEVDGRSDAGGSAVLADKRLGSDEREVGVGHDAQLLRVGAQGGAVAESHLSVGLMDGGSGVGGRIAEAEVARRLGGRRKGHGLSLCHALPVDIVLHGIAAGLLGREGYERQLGREAFARLHLVVLSEVGDEEVVGHRDALQTEEVVEAHAVEGEGHVVFAILAEADGLIGKVGRQLVGTECEHGVAPCLAVGRDIDVQSVGCSLQVACHLEAERPQHADGA